MPEPSRRPIQGLRHVYVVEDDAAVRDSLVVLLRMRACDVHAFADAESFLANGTLVRPACLLLDVKLPGMDGLALQTKLAQEQPALRVVMMTGHGDVGMARTALRAGALDFLEKPLDDEELLEVVELALADSATRLDKLRGDEALRRSLGKLTPREQEVFRRVTDGMHNREIAQEFGISPRTVEVHRARLLDKLQVDRPSDLFRIRFALDLDAPGGAM